MSDLVINQLPGRTFAWLGVNEAVISGLEPCEALHEKKELSEEILCTRKAKTEVYQIPEGCKPGKPAYLWFAYDRSAENIIEIRAGRDSEITIVMDHSVLLQGTEKSLEGHLVTKISVEDRAKVKLIEIRKAHAGVRFVDELHVECGERAGFEITQLFLGEGVFYQDLHCDLKGYESTFLADTAYLIGKQGKLDINYVATHYGKKSVSDMKLNGVLREQADKIFRGTIDFKHGCSGASGTEKEDVLLMDPTVGNKTVPLILCQEENVSGTHGATIGRLGKDLLFYLESRGMTKAEVYEMMARARIDALVKRIADERTRSAIWAEI
ncbi:MAG: SufD family Fe-S cluster assembly protein [Lachnospiraceae bacterium]|nr:SufD family Fe-S cluster assembly protein [Lachnospiraceae bacterium]